MHINFSAKPSPRIEVTVISNAAVKNTVESTDDSAKHDANNNSPSPRTEHKAEDSGSVATTTTLAPDTSTIRPPSGYGMNIPESETIGRNIRQVLWTAYTTASETDQEPSGELNQSDQSDYSSMEQLKDSPRKSNASQTSQTSQTSDSKPQQSSTEDHKRVWVKVNTEGMGSNRFTSYQIEVLVCT